MTELRTDPESSRTSSRRKNAVNGFKRASRRQAAVVGLAVLMGASLFGCHAGPRFFSKKDRADKQELAEKDKGKFINRKKVRPESEFRDDRDEQVAKNDSKSKSNSKSQSAAAKKPSATDSMDRAIATRRQTDEAAAESPRSTKSTTNLPKTSKPADRSEIARRESAKRPVTDLLNDDPLFQDVLPETRTTANEARNANSAARSTAAKSKLMDDDPFKNSVIGPAASKRPEKKVATVNFFDDEELDDEMEEEAEELEKTRLPVAKKTVAKAEPKSNSPAQQTSASATQSKQKFLDETEESSDGTFRSLIGEDDPTTSLDELITPPDPKSVKRTADAAKTVAGQKVLDRRQNVEQTLNDWRREVESDGAATGSDDEVAILAPPASSVRASNTPAAKGHLSQMEIEEFTPPAKSQGAVLNGELIIDTRTLPSRFQRTPGSSTEPSNSKGAGAKANANSGANIDIVPGVGATQNRTRPAGQISLQSLSAEETDTGLTTAAYEASHTPEVFGQLTPLKLDSDSAAGPKLAVLSDDPGIAPAPPEELAENAVGIEPSVSSSGGHAWKRTLLVLGALASAVVIGFGLRRRMELIPEPIRVPKQPRNDSQAPESWPRG